MQAVQEKNLTRQQLEDYHSELTNLYALFHLEMADAEKAEALYIESCHQMTPEKTDISIKRTWNSSHKGQRLIELKHHTKALEKLLSSVKNRIYAIY